MLFDVEKQNTRMANLENTTVWHRHRVQSLASPLVPSYVNIPLFLVMFGGGRCGKYGSYIYIYIYDNWLHSPAVVRRV